MCARRWKLSIAPVSSTRSKSGWKGPPRRFSTIPTRAVFIWEKDLVCRGRAPGRPEGETDANHYYGAPSKTDERDQRLCPKKTRKGQAISRSSYLGPGDLRRLQAAA